MTYRGDFLLAPPARTPFVGPATVPGEFWIYYHLTADRRVLYIGKTSQPETRTRQHDLASPWYQDVTETVWFGPMDQINATAVERELISTEQPPNNVWHTEREKVPTPKVRLRRAELRVDRAQYELRMATRELDRARRVAEMRAEASA